LPPLITPSPTILDHSFPKSVNDLDAVYISLGELELLFNEDKIHFLLTEALVEWVLEYEWSPPENCQKLNLIYQFVSQLFLSPTEGIVRLNLNTIECEADERHPLREDYNNVGWSELWSYELGKLYKIYSDIKCANEDFIAIACEYGFSYGTTRKLADHSLDNSFPIIGNNELSSLSDAYSWVTEAGILNRDVSFNAAKKNIFKLGATKITSPRGGSSHYPVHFKEARTWPLDSNDDPVPLVYLRGLVPITHYPIEVIVHVLLYNELPHKRLKIPDCYIARGF